MIGIRNISKRVRATGLHSYEVFVTVVGGDRSVSARRICTFRHKREDGMAICLEKAVAAVRRAKADEFHELMKGLQEL